MSAGERRNPTCAEIAKRREMFQLAERLVAFGQAFVEADRDYQPRPPEDRRLDEPFEHRKGLDRQTYVLLGWYRPIERIVIASPAQTFPFDSNLPASTPG